ncbi:MAG: tetratricopeptide repeat protein [Spirochaetales bacterium]
MAVQKKLFKSKDELKKAYLNCKPIFTVLLTELEKIIKDNLQLVSMPSYKARIKEFTSYYRKLVRTEYNGNQNSDFPLVTDLLGMRIICPFLEDLGIIEQQLGQLFDFIEVERKGASRNFSEFGYESTHILINIPEHIISEQCTDAEKALLPTDLVCEIQIRTILQDAWAEVEHELVYKAEFSPFDFPLRRKLYSMNASFSLAEIVFQEIRDYQNKLNSELDRRRLNFYEQADVLSVGKLDADDEITKSFGPVHATGNVSPYVKGTIDDMILDALQAHNSGNTDKAIAIYTRILQASPPLHAVVRSVIHKHRGMAYFAKNQYDEAKQDFLTSVENDPNNFRSLYYAGIACSVLNKEEEALEYFDRSLEINDHQAHVYYRKALALFHLNLFGLALENLNAAAMLGLDDEECKKLKQLLCVKLDIT